MRLICPNCDAQYEVPDEVMPVEGRDVQCSNCGQTWFQRHPDHDQDPVSAEEDVDADEEVIRADDEDQALDPPSEAPDSGPPSSDPDAPEPETEPDEMAEEAKEHPEPESEPDLSGSIAPKRRELDPAVADILREEAEFEQQLRQKEPPSPVESQPDLGLEEAGQSEDANKRAREASDRMARMRGEDPDAPAEAAATAAALGSRRDLLPDIEEINSTLRSSDDRGGGDPSELANVAGREKRGFRRGFTLIVLLVALLALMYIFAPALIDAVPALEGALTAYVSMIDSLRAWLDGQMTSLLTWLDDTAAASSNG